LRAALGPLPSPKSQLNVSGSLSGSVDSFEKKTRVAPASGLVGPKLKSAVGGRVATVTCLVSVSVFISSSPFVTVSETVYVPAVAKVR
jgi:hypothetical protein